MVRVAVLVSGGGTGLQSLLDAEKRGELGQATIALVISNRKAAYALERAKNAGVPTKVLSKAMEPDPERYDERLLAILQENDIQLIALAGFLQILGQRTVAAYENRIINIHPSLIPSFCGKGYYGLRVHEEALKRGVKVTGATAHLVNLGVDEGPILLQKAVEVQEGDDAPTLQRRVMEQAEWIILPQAVRLVADRWTKEDAR